MTNSNEYIGNELELFEKAVNWKTYYGQFIKQHLRGRILEIGAGIGGTTAALCDGTQEDWTCLEMDGNLSEKINELRQNGSIPSICRVVTGTVDSLSENDIYDVIIYIDVMEHIDDDSAEVIRALNHLKTGGKLIVLVPAHQWLYSPFDKAIGHYRRYNKEMMKAIVPDIMTQEQLFYLDSVGMAASVANMLFLKQFYPTEKQLKFWDDVLIRASRVMDMLLRYSVGKSLMGIWKK
ncbi:MAG: class I SAM-dependent methyltransferase [Nitrospira sp.]|nr:class I SAM-dependent methyltransferase [bacterium]MBL7050187.1 class I SAM-dependent methyltransferase [Nitrospira sp.]